MQSNIIENQDLLVAICLRVEDAQDVLRLSAVSKTFRSAANSDPVWRSIIHSMFGQEILNISVESLEKHQLRSQFPFSIMSDQGNRAPRKFSGEKPAWTLRDAFSSILLALSHDFVDCPEHAVSAFTRDLATDAAGARAASFILWCSPRRRGLPDIRPSAIRVRRPL